MFKSIKRIEVLEEKMDKLMVYVPKLYQLLVNMKPAYPCETFEREVCLKCEDITCKHNKGYQNTENAEDIMKAFISFHEETRS